MMNPLDFLNQNPALTSIVAFPVGLILLLGVLKLVGLDPQKFLIALKDHIKAEMEIEGRLEEFVAQVKELIESNSEYRKHVDRQLESYNEQHAEILGLLRNILKCLPKRKGETWEAET